MSDIFFVLSRKSYDNIHIDIIKANLSVRQTEEYVRVVNEGKSKGSQGFVEEEYPESYTRLVEHLERFFSQNIAIKRTKSGGGKITIGFESDKDFAAQLLEETNILIGAGSGFYCNDKEHFRVVALPEADQLRDMFAKMAEFLKSRDTKK